MDKFTKYIVQGKERDLVILKDIKGGYTEEEEWAKNKLNEFNYRKEFSLSQQEFEEEDYSSYLINGMIMGMMAKYTRELDEKEKRKMKRGSKQH